MEIIQEHAVAYAAENDSDQELALDSLIAACREFQRLADTQHTGGALPFHRSIAAVHTICDALTQCEIAGVPEDAIRAVIGPARDLHAASPFVTRLQQWPRGYPGDFETIEWLWRADNRAPTGTLAHAIEHYALTAAISQQHRNKVTFQAGCMLRAFSESRSCRILSIGCGSSPDLRSVMRQVPEDATIVLCDSDADALAFSRARLGPVADRVHLVHGMAPRVLRRAREHGPFDLILAGGLFDYLSDRAIVRTLVEAWPLLNPSGRMVFTNIARGNPFRVWIEYFGEWRLIERSEDDIASICSAAGVSAPSMVRDATSLAIVATVA
jgi:hypothetical protein